MKTIVLISILFLVFARSDKIKDEEKAQKFLDYVEVLITDSQHKSSLAEFNLDTNVTDENQQIVVSL